MPFVKGRRRWSKQIIKRRYSLGYDWFANHYTGPDCDTCAGGYADSRDAAVIALDSCILRINGVLRKVAQDGTELKMDKQ